MYYNSIYMSGASLDAIFNGSSACIGIANTVGAGSMDIRNNALQNSQMLLRLHGVGRRDGEYGLPVSSSLNTIFSNINYNDYLTNGHLPRDRVF